VRKEFVSTIEKISEKDSTIVFITNDLGYTAFENLRSLLGERFINAGVAEQNMIGVAAGMAHKGYKIFCYSIAPFIVYRCLEQFRNDVCFHKLPVFLVGNGGGYGYGVMGSAHHTLNDIAFMSSMPNATGWVPAFNNDVEGIVTQIVAENKPAYVRLNNSIASPANYALSECINAVSLSNLPGLTIVTTGSIIVNVLEALNQHNLYHQVDLFSAYSFPISLNDTLIESIKKTKKILVVEEHVSTGGLAQQLSEILMKSKLSIANFKTLSAKEHSPSNYGDQAYHQNQSDIGTEAIGREVCLLLKIVFN
jgi:transketolase